MGTTVFGVDRLTLSGYVSDVQLPEYSSPAPWEVESWWKGSDGELRPIYRASKFEVGKGSVFVAARETAEGHELGPYHVRMDWNPSRQWFGPTGELLPFCDLPAAVEEVVSGVYPLVRILDAEQMKLSRIDLTRDFRPVIDLPCVLSALAESSPRLFRGPHRQVETCEWPSGKAGKVIAYDKGKQLRNGDEGWLRTEVVCRTTWLQNAGVSTLGSLDADRADALARHHWLSSGLGTSMLTTERDVVRQLMHKGLSDKAVMSFLGWCLCRDIPGGPEVSPTTLAKYRRLEKALGGVDLSLKPSHSMRLDLDSGTVVKERLAS